MLQSLLVKLIQCITRRLCSWCPITCLQLCRRLLHHRPNLHHLLPKTKWLHS